MIGKTSRGANFFALASYLRAGLNGDRPERVEWIQARNLATDDLTVAPHVMKATADLSSRVQKPCYHLSVSWAHEDRVDSSGMADVADRLLADIGLAEHQAIMVAHNDTDHQHLHIMVNRVHPDTGKAWHGAYDYRAIETSLRDQERAHEFRYVPGRHSGLTREERSPERSELALAAREDRPPLLRFSKDKCRSLKDKLSRSIRSASSWTDLEAKLGRRGLRLDQKGAGLIVADNYGYAKLSDLTPRERRVKDLVKTFGSFAKHRELQRRRKERQLGVWQRERDDKAARLKARARRKRRERDQDWEK